MESSNASTCVRKHPAPEGALRPYLRIREVNLVFVRKHPAPEGALRRGMLFRMYSESSGPKAPSTRRNIKTGDNLAARRKIVSRQKASSTTRCIKTAPAASTTEFSRQKAPSTRRCIKTRITAQTMLALPLIRKHPAPQGALRHRGVDDDERLVVVRKQPAPQGALRPTSRLVWKSASVVRKHPAPEGALRHH